MRTEQGLRAAAALYGAGLVLHIADHVRRGTELLTSQVNVAGIVSTAAGVITVALILARHRLAPVAAVAFGFPAALGITAVHLLPDWGVFSDAFPGAAGTGVTPWSWAVVLVEIAGALALGIFGLLALSRLRGASPAK